MTTVSSNVLTPEGVASHPHLFETQTRKTKPGDRPAKPMFSMVTLFTREAMDSPLGAALKKAVQDAAIARFGKEAFATMLEEDSFASPFRRDLTSKGYDPKRFICYISSASGADYPPAVVANEIDPGTGKRRAIKDKREVYPGARVHVSVSARAYGGLNTGYKPGVMLDLRNVCKVGDGERLAGGSSNPDEDFGAGIAAPAAPATPDSMSDLLA